MEGILKTLDQVLLGVIVLGLVGSVLYFWYRKSEDRLLVPKWILSAPVLGLLIFYVFPMAARGTASDQLEALVLTLIGGGILALIWTPNIAAAVAKPFSNIFFPDTELEARPFYSTAEYRRRHGRYEEALNEVQAQLEQFPTDPQGHFLLAEIQAIDLQDLDAAAETVEQFLAQPGHAPKNQAYILNRLADWHLRLRHDPEGARQALQRVVDQFPETEMAHMAGQRIAHLPDPTRFEPKRSLQVQPTVGYPGLQGHTSAESADQKRSPPDTKEREQTLLDQLERHPEDFEAREELAWLYAKEHSDPGRAVEELECLTEIPHMPVKQVCHWLNLLADIHVQYRHDAQAARDALNRIVTHYPDTPYAENARKRLAFVDREVRSRKPSPTLKLGTYDQNIGLKKSR